MTAMEYRSVWRYGRAELGLLGHDGSSQLIQILNVTDASILSSRGGKAGGEGRYQEQLTTSIHSVRDLCLLVKKANERTRGYIGTINTGC